LDVGIAKELLKGFIAKTFSPAMQHKARRFYLTRRVLAGREFHEVEMNVLGSMIASGDSVADIGANVGAYTRQLSSLVGASGKVHAFEPVSHNYDILSTVVRKGRLSNVQLHRLALGSEIAEAEIAVPDLGGFTGYYWAHLAKPGEHGERVKVETLDTLRRAKIIAHLDFIKCDVEGFELEVIRGGRELIDADHPTWLLEVSRDTSAAVFAALSGHGYRAFVYDGKLVPTEGYRDKEFSNYFFIHPSSKVATRLNAARVSI
jgi:FkbM family methyltransferase